MRRFSQEQTVHSSLPLFGRWEVVAYTPHRHQTCNHLRRGEGRDAEGNLVRRCIDCGAWMAVLEEAQP